MLLYAKFVTVIATLMMLCGCIGIGVLYPKNSPSTDNPGVSVIAGSYSTYKDKHSLNCTEVIQKWGEPSRTYKRSDEIVLVYKDGLRWAGIMPIIGVPIPIALPVGRKSTSLVCKGDQVIKAMKAETGVASAYCGIISEKPEYGCRTENN